MSPSPYSLPATLHPALTGREAVVDALHRCVTAFDTSDGALFDTAFTPDGVFEINGRPLTGLPEIHAAGLALIFKLDTTHMATNVRVDMKTAAVAAAEGTEEASLTSTVLSQHFALDKGTELGQKNLLAGSLYRGDLVRGGDGLWRFRYLQIKSVWMQGDYSVIGGEFREVEK